MVERRPRNYNAGPSQSTTHRQCSPVSEAAVTPELRTQLESLRASLARIDSLDAESRALLIQLLPEITRLLGRSETTDDKHPLTEPLESLAVRFEADHPALGSALRQVVDALGKAGI
jgi:hypothetical protein